MTRFRMELTVRIYADTEASDAQTAISKIVGYDVPNFMSNKPKDWQFFICPLTQMRIINIDTLREIDLSSILTLGEE